jgi:hypothetical protein
LYVTGPFGYHSNEVKAAGIQMKKALKLLSVRISRLLFVVGTNGQISNLLIQDLRAFGTFIKPNGGLISMESSL